MALWFSVSRFPFPVVKHSGFWRNTRRFDLAGQTGNREPETANRKPETGNGSHNGFCRCGFSLLELIFAMSILAAVVAVLAQVTGSVQQTWRRGKEGGETADMASRALDLLAADLAAAVAPQFSDAAEDSDSAATSAIGSRSPLVFAVWQDREEVPEEGEASSDGFSQLLLTSRTPGPVWDGRKEDGSSVPIPSRRRSSAPLLRSVVGVGYSVEPAPQPSSQAEDNEESDSPRFALVRRVAGLRPGDDADWWSSLDEVPGETVARNVVWFSVTVPAYPECPTNAASSVSVGDDMPAYATRTDDSLELPDDVVSGPLPRLVDVALGLVTERDMREAEALSGDDREERLRQRTRMYVRRVALWRVE